MISPKRNYKTKKNVNNCKNLQTMKILFKKCNLFNLNDNESSQFTNFFLKQSIKQKKIR